MAGRDPSTPPPDRAADEAGNGPQPWGAGAASPYARWRRRGVWAAAAVVVLAAVAIGWSAIESVMPRAVTDIFASGGIFASGDAPADPETAVLAMRIEALESAVAGLDGRIAAAAAKAGASMPRSEAARLDARVAALETRPAPRPPPPDLRVAPLVERVEALAARLDALATGVPSAESGDAPAENARLSAALGRMAERIAGVEAALEVAGDPRLAEKVESAGARVDGIEAELKRLATAERTRKGDALLLAVGQLREAAAGPRPFDAELQLVLKAAGGDAGIEDAAKPLAAVAPAGIPTRAALENRFPALAAKAAQSALAPEDGDWLDRTASRLSRVVTIRRVGEGIEEGEGALAVIARAESRLAAGDLAAASAALDRLDGAPAKAFDDWRKAAAARAAADAAIAGLSRRAVERFAAAEGGG